MDEKDTARPAADAGQDKDKGTRPESSLQEERAVDEIRNLNPVLFAVQSRDGKAEGDKAASLEAGTLRGPAGSGEEEEVEETYPEGGLRAWLVVLGSWMALVASLGLMNTIGVLQSYVVKHQLSGYAEGTTGWIFSVYTFVSFFLGLYIGPVFDKYGPRWLVASGTALLATGTMLLGSCVEYWHFMVVFGLVNGAATALLFTPSIAAVGHWFRDRRGLATGVAASGGGVGGVVFPLLLSSLLERAGFAWAVRAMGLVCTALAVGANFLIRSRLPPERGASARPDPRILRDPAFGLTTLGIFLMEFGLFIPLGFLPLYARAQGFDAAFSFRIMTVLNAASVVGRALPGWWADIIGPANANILATVQSIVACLAVWWPAGGTTAGIVVFAVLFGFASGTNISLAPLCIGRLCKTQNYGRYYATTYTIVSFACLVGIPIAGNIVGVTEGGRYWGLILFTGLLYCASLVAFVAARVYVVGWNPLVVF
ncbi:hypothetical protein RB595_010014 [Gaeumannomyces hyphopodioides]